MSTRTAVQAVAAPLARSERLRPAWVVWASSVLLALSAALLLASLVVGAYNVRYSYHRIVEIVSASDTTAIAANPASADLFVPAWVRPFLQDLSVVSPSLVAFTSACMLIAAVLLIWVPSATSRLSALHFPFPAVYKTYYVQFGLLGTIVGFVIAFSDIDLSAERQSLILVEALGTALWSTLTAIFLAYGACPVVERIYQQLRWPGAHVATDTRSALEVLRQRTVDAADSLAALTASASGLSGELGVQHLHGRIGRLEETLSRVAEDLSALTRVAGEFRSYQEETEAHARMTEAWVEATEQRLAGLDTRVQELTQSVGRLVSTVDELGTSAARLQEEDIPTQSERLDAIERRVAALVQTLKTALE